jgi:hypothetical protein
MGKIKALALLATALVGRLLSVCLGYLLPT